MCEWVGEKARERTSGGRSGECVFVEMASSNTVCARLSGFGVLGSVLCQLSVSGGCWAWGFGIGFLLRNPYHWPVLGGDWESGEDSSSLFGAMHTLALRFWCAKCVFLSFFLSFFSLYVYIFTLSHTHTHALKIIIWFRERFKDESWDFFYRGCGCDCFVSFITEEVSRTR